MSAKTGCIVAAVFFSLYGPFAAPGANGIWTNNAAGNWSATNNWADGKIADGAASTAWFTNAIPASRVVTIDGASRTLGTVNLGAAGGLGSFTIAANTGLKLTLDNSGAHAQVNQNGSSKGDTISSPLALADSLDVANESATKALTLSGAITSAVAGARTIANIGAGSGGVTISGVIGNGAGSVGVEQNSAACPLTLGGANGFTNGLRIKAGTVIGITSANAFGATNNVITLGDASGSQDTVLGCGGALTFVQPILVAGGNTGMASLTNTATVYFNGPVTLNNHALKVFSSASSTVMGGGITGTGTLLIAAVGGSSGINIQTLPVNHAGTITNSGVGPTAGLISGGVGSNVVAITEAATNSALNITGLLSVNSAGTALANNNASGAALLTVSGGVRGVGDLVLNNNGPLTNGITLMTGAITNTGRIVNSGTGTGNALVSAVIGVNVAGVVQNSGTSPLVLSGANTYPGGTEVMNGTLLATNTAGSATGPGAVTINNGGTLQGNGLIAGTVTNRHGGVLAPGFDGVPGGTLTVGSLVWNGGGAIKCEVASIANNEAGAGLDYDQIVVTNTLTAVPGGSNLVIRLDSLGQALAFQTNRNYSLKLITCGKSASLNPTDVTLDTNNFLAGGTWAVTNLNNAIYVTCLGADPDAKNYWRGAGNWSTAANWSKGHAPLPGEDVEFDFMGAANCTADAVSNGLGSLTLAQGYTGTLTVATKYPGQGDFTNLFIAGDCVLNGGTVSPAANPAGNTEVNRLSLRVGGAFMLASNAAVNADGRGFAAGSYGPGKGSSENYAGWGASHGGWDAERQSPGPYGSITSPTNLGSSCDARAGGGAILLEVAGACTIEGTISAIGMTVTANPGGYNAGAGGSILIRAASASGSGLITARGGNGYHGGAAGGGRVAFILTGSQDFGRLRIVAPGGSCNVSGTNYRAYEGSAGTVYLEHAGHQPGKGILVIAEFNTWYRYTMPNWPATEMPTATASRAAVNLDDFSLIVISNGGTLALTRDTVMTNWGMGRLQVYGAENSFISVRGTNGVVFPADLVVSNYSLHLDVPVQASGNWTVAAGGNVSHSFASSLNLALDGDFTVRTGGMVSAHRRGYVSGGPGGSGASYESGPSHGGRGGIGYAAFKKTYGSVLGPAQWGSQNNTRGGGAVKLSVSGTLSVTGPIEANADTNFAANGYYGSGSGGSVWLQAGTYSGTGSVSASGGPGYIGPGGGGRIALVEAGGSGLGLLACEAAGGYSSQGKSSAPGTIYRQASGVPDGAGVVTIYAPASWTPGADPVNTNTYCELPVTAGGVTDNLSRVTLEIVQRGRLGLSADLTVGDLYLRNGTNTMPQLILNGRTLYVKSFEHSDWGSTNWVRYDGGQIVWKTLRGTVILIR